MRSPQEKGADPEPEQDRGPVLRGREPIAVEEVCQEQRDEDRRDHP
ncbi:MAG: hypothetical protein ABWY11_21440 [Umezawaea sp.]